MNIIFEKIKLYENIVFVGNGFKLNETIFKNLNYIINENNFLHASMLGLCGYNKYKSGIIQNSDTILPMYLRLSQAERMKSKNG